MIRNWVAISEMCVGNRDTILNQLVRAILALLLFMFMLIFVLISLKVHARCPGHTSQLSGFSKTKD